VARKVDLTQVPDVAALITAVERDLGNRGRLLVRYSGTEPVLRVMLEGPDSIAIRRWAEEIASAVKRRLGN